MLPEPLRHNVLSLLEVLCRSPRKVWTEQELEKALPDIEDLGDLLAFSIKRGAVGWRVEFGGVMKYFFSSGLFNEFNKKWRLCVLPDFTGPIVTTKMNGMLQISNGAQNGIPLSVNYD